MANDDKFDLMLLRYVPDAVKQEFVNIGVLLMQSDGAWKGFAEVRLTRDWRRVRCLDPAADVEMLEAMEAEIRTRLKEGGADRERILHLLRDSFSNTVQVTAPTACLTDSPEDELQRLTEIYLVTKRHAPRQREHAGRGAILGRMRDEFEAAGVWPLMRKKIAVAPFTHKGDPLKLDCGYRPNGVIKFFQVVSLAGDVDAAKALAFSYPQIREGVARQEQAKCELTAIVEDDLNRQEEAVAFALETLERSSILVAPTSELPRLAEVARRELRV
jgi:hypothetical protein